MLGTEEDFVELCSKAKEMGIDIILDGVFSHTGADSIYFNKFGRYGEKTGAYRDRNSPYYSWYSFIAYPERYACLLTLPMSFPMSSSTTSTNRSRNWATTR